MKVSRVRTSIVIGLFAVVVSSCGSADEASNAPVVQVQLGRYTIEPATLIVPSGAVELQVTNVDTMAHNLVVAGYGTRTLAPGTSQTLPIDTDAGEYRMLCDVVGHAAMGQTGVLRSEDVVSQPTNG